LYKLAKNLIGVLQNCGWENTLNLIRIMPA